MINLSSTTIYQSDYTAWTTYQYAKTRLVSTRVYHDIPQWGGAGTEGENYLQTSYGFENYGSGKMGRQNRVETPDGTITRYVFDARGNVLETWIGTNDENASDRYPQGIGPSDNNMVKTASYEYDAAGNMVAATRHADPFQSYATLYQYDWRNRVSDVLSPGDVVTHYEFDNLGRALWTKTYASADFTLSSGELRGQSQNLYDSQGRVYQSRLYEVNPDDGTVGDYLPSYTWYDAAGRTIKTADGNGLSQKTQYDGLGRTVVSYVCFDADEEDYAEALDVSGDTVVEQVRYYYDEASRMIATAAFQRLPDDTATTGALDATNSYATASVVWHDGLGRTVATADFGREDVGSAWTHYFFDGATGALIDANSDGIPDAAQAAPPEPYTPQTQNSMAGIDFQLQLVEYDAAGRAHRTIDNTGRVNETQYDDAGRVVKTIQNYHNGTVEETDADRDVTVEYEYDSFGRLATVIVYNAKGDDGLPFQENVEQQKTRYLYESPINASWQTGVVYPDSEDSLSQNQTTKVWTITTDLGDHVSTTYDRLGRATAKTDQRGVVHEYLFDSAGRLAHDCVTGLGTSGIVDDAILRISTTYDDIGRVETITSHDDPDPGQGSVVNQVAYVYNGWGNLAREYQAHDGAVDPQTTPGVQYGYADGASGGVAKYVRLSQVTYPNGREIEYDYAAGVDDVMSRLSEISDSAGTLAAYKYLGLGRIVEEVYDQVDMKLSYLDSSGNVTGFDRFGRVAEQVWTNWAEDEIDWYTYGYDRAGNRVSKTNELNHDFDEVYEYDQLDRLISALRDDDFDQSWTLDGLGNFAEFDDDGDAQTRETNAANEIESITGGWVTPTYDAAGNMLSAPKSGDETTRIHFVRDAWNRLVAVYADDQGEPGDLIAEYEYDGANRRIEKVVAEDGGGPAHAHYFYNSDWQLLEERFVDGQGTIDYVNEYVWSARYIDAPIVRFHDFGGDGELFLPDDSIHYFTTDANHNVTAWIEGLGSWDVHERYVYSAYGTATVYFSNWTSPTAPYEDGSLYCGYFFDAETANYLARNRYYNAALATWISRDPIGYKGGINLYEYVGNNPVSYVDPSGLIGIFFDGAGQGRGSPTIMRSMYDKYTDAAAIFYTNIWPNNIWANIRKAREIICDTICNTLQGCPPQPTEPVDLFGWSRGAVAVLTLAKILNDEGCTCNGKTFKPIKIRFMGLIDPVATGGYQMVGTNSTVVPPNVGTVFTAYAGQQSRLGWWVFNATHPNPQDSTATSASDATFDYIHENIGFDSATDVQAAIEAAAGAAGVPIKK